MMKIADVKNITEQTLLRCPICDIEMIFDPIELGRIVLEFNRLYPEFDVMENSNLVCDTCFKNNNGLQIKYN